MKPLNCSMGVANAAAATESAARASEVDVISFFTSVVLSASRAGAYRPPAVDTPVVPPRASGRREDTHSGRVSVRGNRSGRLRVPGWRNPVAPGDGRGK